MSEAAIEQAALGRVRTLEVILTANCNLRCSYCYQNAKQARRLEWGTLRAALDVLLASAQPEVSVVFLGGEPLLEIPLIRAAVEYVRSRALAGKRVRYSLSTNGLLLDDEALDLLDRGRFEVQLSHDGVPAAQDFRGAGTHAKLDALLTTLAHERPRFWRDRWSVALTVHSSNLKYLAESVAYFIEKRVKRIVASPLHTHDAGWTDAHKVELERQFARILERSLDHYRETGEVPFEGFRQIGQKSPVGSGRRSMCGVARGEAIAVDVDGQVNGCATFLGSYQALPTELLRGGVSAMSMGDVRSPSFATRLAMYPRAAAATGLFDRKQDKRSSYGHCGECRHLGECSVCPTSIGHIPGNVDPDRVPDHACAYNLVALSCKEKFPVQRGPLDRLLDGRRREKAAEQLQEESRGDTV